MQAGRATTPRGRGCNRQVRSPEPVPLGPVGKARLMCQSAASDSPHMLGAAHVCDPVRSLADLFEPWPDGTVFVSKSCEKRECGPHTVSAF